MRILPIGSCELLRLGRMTPTTFHAIGTCAGSHLGCLFALIHSGGSLSRGRRLGFLAFFLLYIGLNAHSPPALILCTGTYLGDVDVTRCVVSCPLTPMGCSLVHP